MRRQDGFSILIIVSAKQSMNAEAEHSPHKEADNTSDHSVHLFPPSYEKHHNEQEKPYVYP